MKRVFNGRTLGIALAEGAARVVEVRRLGVGGRIERAEEFRFAEGLTWDDPAALGRAFGQFLSARKFGTRRAALGLPAAWLMARAITLPPSAPEAAAAMARMQAERLYASEAERLVFDCAEGREDAQGRTLLLAATTRERLEAVAAFARAARLKPLAVTSETLCLAQCAARADRPDEVCVVAREGGADAAVRRGGGFAALQSLCGDLRWEIGRVRMEAGAAAAADSAALTVWGVERLTPEAREALTAAGGETRTDPAPDGLHGGTPEFLPAAATALCAGGEGRVPLDFLHSRLTPPRVSRFGSKTWWALAAGVAAAVGVAALVAAGQRERAETDALARQLLEMKPQIEAAQRVVDRLNAARPWYEDRPRVLDALSDVTAAFPTEGTVWATNLTLKPVGAGRELRGALSGKAREERAVIETLDRLRKAKTLTDLKLVYLREAGRATREVSFAVTFNFKPAE